MYGSQSSFERSAVQLPVVAAVGGGLVTGAFGDGVDGCHGRILRESSEI